MRSIILLGFLVMGMLCYAQTPTTASSNFSIDNKGCNELTFSWTNGNGNGRLVLVRKNSSINSMPVKDEFYTSNSTFGNGELLGSDIYVVYKGTGNSCTIYGLEKNTTYYIAVFEYNGGGSVFDYLTSSYLESNVTTEDISVSFSINDASQCLKSNNFAFTGNIICNKSPVAYAWNYGDGNTATGKNVSHTYSNYGIYVVTLTGSAPGCIEKITLQDTANPHPVVKFKLNTSIPGNDSSQCFFGNKFSFSNQTILPPVGGISSCTYLWNYGNGEFTTSFPGNRSYKTDGNFKVKLYAVSNAGCADSNFTFVDVKTRPIDISKVSIKDTSICVGGIVSFEDLSANSLNHKWNFGDASAEVSGRTANHQYNVVGKYYVILKANDLLGCNDQHRDSIRVSVLPNNNFSGLAAEYCLNDPKVYLKPLFGKGTFLGTNTDASDSSFNPLSTGIFKIGYLLRKGNCRDTVFKITEVKNRPNFNFGKDSVLCDGENITISVGNPAFNTKWNTGSTNTQLTISKSGTYIAEAKEGNCAFSDTIKFTFLKLPNINLGRDTNLCGGSLLKFTATGDNIQTLWNDGSTSNTKSINESGYYQVSTKNKCKEVRDSINVTIEPTACNVFFPNAFSPDGDGLNEVWQPIGKYTFRAIEVFDRWGQLLFSSKSIPYWDGKLNNTVLPIGVYFIRYEYFNQEGNGLVPKNQGFSVNLVY